nr:uncharacterized protein I203_08410 [Kwoniella mangroviensis CBS 8507]OCF62515.1 hypothetical protein I203_08410 [Kwoniella mangroviensis CBS 8507]
MFKFTLLALLVTSLSLATSALAVKGSVKVTFADTTYSHMTADPYERGLEGAWREFPFDKVDTRSFYWYGPKVGDSTDRAWRQTCDVSVDDQFNEDETIKFELQDKKAGFKGPKDKHAEIVCKDSICTVPNGGKCEGDYVIPVVDSVSLIPVPSQVETGRRDCSAYATPD